jgi:hypothetical protein
MINPTNQFDTRTAYVLITNTHRCIRAVFYCGRCDLLYVPPSMIMADPTVRLCGDWEVPYVVIGGWSQFACHVCHLTVCGGWLAVLFTALGSRRATD